MKKALLIIATFAAMTAFGAGQDTSPDQGKPDQGQADQQKPDQKPDQEKPDQQKPDQGQNDQQKPDQKPDQEKPDQDQDQAQQDQDSIFGHHCNLVTVEVCGLSEVGEGCQTVRYCHRPSTGVPPEPFNPSDEHMVRPAERYGIPAWLRALNEHFGGHRGEHGNNPSNPNWEAP